MFFTPSTFQNEFDNDHGQEGILSPYDPEAWSTGYDLHAAEPDFGPLQNEPRMSAANSTQDRARMSTNLPDESHQGVGWFLGEDAGGKSDLTDRSNTIVSAASATPSPKHTTPLSEVEKIPPFKSSPGSLPTTSSRTISPVEPAASFQFVQYSPTKKQRKSQTQASRVEKTRAKEGKSRASSSRAAALQTDKVRSPSKANQITSPF